MNKTYAVIKDGTVINLVIWDGKRKWNTPDELVEVSEGIGCQIGYSYLEGKFITNIVPPEDPVDLEAVKIKAIKERLSTIKKSDLSSNAKTVEVVMDIIELLK